MNPRSTLLLALFAMLCSSLCGQLHYKSSQSIGSPGTDFCGRMLADDTGHLYAMLQFRDTADVDPGPGTDIVFPKSSPVISLIKSDAAGNHLWASRFYTIGTISANLMEIKGEQIRIAVRFTDSLYYELHGETIIQHYAPGLNTCILTLSLDGEVVQATYFANLNVININDLHSLANGNTLIGGTFEDTLSYPGAPPLVSNGKLDLFYMLLNPDMEVIWATSFGSSQNEYTSKLVLYEETRFYCVVSHRDTVIMPTLAGNVECPAAGITNTIVATINLDGDIERVFTITSDEGTEINDFLLDKDENVYVGGYFAGTANFAHPSQTPAWMTSIAADDGYVARYSPEGMLDWVNVYTSTDYSFMTNLALERDTDLYFGGGTTGVSDLDPTADSTMVLADARTDIMLGKLQLDGTQLYAYHFNGPQLDGLVNLIVSDANSTVTISGFFGDSLDCDFTDHDAFVVSNGNDDIFTIVFDEENVITSTDKPVSTIAFTTYPNPVSDVLHISHTEAIGAVTLHAMDGRKAGTYNFNSALAGEIDMSALLPGMYCVSVHTGDTVVTQRVVVE